MLTERVLLVNINKYIYLKLKINNIEIHKIKQYFF